jgi:predicted RNA-binding Zn ribbon-like protein
MSKLSRKFKVPDELANLYDFANSLDVRRFTHHGVQHPQSDELTGPQELGAWMAQRGMLADRAKFTPVMFEEALELRSAIRAYLQFDPDERRKNKDGVRSLDAALESFPLTVKTASGHSSTLAAVRGDALSGLSVVVAELYDGSRNGTLDRLKMCASEECRRVFFDRSKPATRRWCMSTLCGNRIKTRAYRERQRSLG